MDNNDFYNSDNIREPDSVKTERLVDDNNTGNTTTSIIGIDNYDDELNNVLELSKHEFNIIQKQEQENRKNEFKSVRHKLNRLVLFDRRNSEKYELILSIITIYEDACVTEYILSEPEFEGISKLLKTIRLTNQETESLKKLICC